MGRKSTGTVEPLTNSIRLKFTHLSKRESHTLPLEPTARNLIAANRLLSDVMRHIERGTYVASEHFEDAEAPSSGPTFREYADGYCETMLKARSTCIMYRSALRAGWYPAFGDKPIAEILQSDVVRATFNMKQTILEASVNSRLVALRQIFKSAVANRLIPNSPTDGVKNLPVQPAKPDPFTSAERDAILAHMKAKYHPSAANYYTVSFHTGIRPSEQIALLWSDVDWQRRTLRITRAKVVGEIKETKTRRERFVDLSDAALAALTAQKEHTFLKNAAIFENPTNRRPWPSDQLQRMNYFIPSLRALGLHHRDAYQCRHTFASILLMADVNPVYISKQLGHKDTAMLFQVYGHWMEREDDGRQAAKLNIALGGSAR